MGEPNLLSSSNLSRISQPTTCSIFKTTETMISIACCHLKRFGFHVCLFVQMVQMFVCNAILVPFDKQQVFDKLGTWHFQTSNKLVLSSRNFGFFWKPAVFKRRRLIWNTLLFVSKTKSDSKTIKKPNFKVKLILQPRLKVRLLKALHSNLNLESLAFRSSKTGISRFFLTESSKNKHGTNPSAEKLVWEETKKKEKKKHRHSTPPHVGQY